MPMQEKKNCLNFGQAIFNLAKFFKIKALQYIIFYLTKFTNKSSFGDYISSYEEIAMNQATDCDLL